MATGKTGYLDFTPSASWAKVRAYYKETYDLASNTSDVTITSIQIQSANWYGVTYYADGVLKINGQTVLTLDSSAGSALVAVSAQNTWYTLVEADNTDQPITATLKGIAHKNDGSKSVSVELAANRFSRFGFYTASGGAGSGWGVSQTLTLALTDIPRASPIAATDANIGAVSTVAVTRRSTAHTHSVGFTFGELSGWLDADGTILSSEKKLAASTIPFAIPESFYGQIPNAPYGTCTLYCKTYSGTTQIGDTQTTVFRLTADPAACAPLVSGSVVDTNEAAIALTGDASKLIRYASSALCTVSASAQNGAAIAAKTIGGVAVSGDTRTISGIESGTVVFSAADSRGYTGTAKVTLDLIPYIPLTLNAAAKRTDPTSGDAVLTLKGKYFNGSFGAADNALTLRYTVGDRSGQIEATLDGNTYWAQIGLSGLDYRTSHAIQITAGDALMSLSATASVGKGIPVFDWGEGDFVFHVPVALEGGFTAEGKSLLDQVYPVGSVYMSAGDTAPAFGGTWAAVENQLGLYLWKRTA